MTNVPKLYYYDMAGKAEVARLVFHVGGVAFEDVRVDKADWPKLKPEMPLGKMPVLEVDGVKIPESIAIYLYAAQVAKLMPKSPVDQAMAYSVMMQIYNEQELYIPILGRILTGGYAGNEEKKIQDVEAHLNTSFIPHLQMLEKCVEPGASGFLFDDTITVADISVYVFMDFIISSVLTGLPPKPELKSHFSKLGKVYDAVANHPKVKSWNEHKGAKNLN